MEQTIFYIVDIGTSSCVFNNIKDASYFMREAAEHIKIGKYQVHTPTIFMSACTYEKLCEEFPNEYKAPEDREIPEAQEVENETTT